MTTTWHADPSHPRHVACPKCGASPGEFCTSKNGRTLVGYERQHAARFSSRKAPLRRDGADPRQALYIPVAHLD